MIREGTYEPGDRLPSISEMASRFEVGHPTLREALKKLEVLGTVEIKHGSGVYVKNDQDVLLMSNPIFAGEVSKDMMLDLIEARIPIELTSAEGAARNASDENIERLEELLEKADEHMDDDAYLTEVNMAFHREIAVASGNTVMAQVLEVLANLFEKEQRMLLDIHGSREEDHADHLGILEAIREGDPALARDRMEQHLEGVRRMAQQWEGE
jgi:GntR family transcriptional repressor for pyruvate dehydrogenase complex